MKTTKAQALKMFREIWAEQVKRNPSMARDSMAKRESFNYFMDSLHRDGKITDKQVFNWSNPF